MSPGEIAGRGLDTARHVLWTRRQVVPGDATDLPADLLLERAAPAGLPAAARDRLDPAAHAALLTAADAVLSGTWSVFGTARRDSADPDWFADPATGRRAPQRTLCFRVHHRDEGEVGNVKQIWELSRHHHLTVLAAAYWATGEERYAETVAQQLRSWWRDNPFLSGIHWTSGIELGIRLISWVWIRRLLADWPKVEDLFENDDAALRQIAWHSEFLAAFPSRGTSANNHLIAEAAGALAAACAFGWYGRSPWWRRRAAAGLEDALAANTFPDGLNREQASEYHAFVTDLALLAALEADAARQPLGDRTWRRLVAMLDAAAAVTDAAGRPPRQGDGDEGRALVVDHPDHPAWRLTLDGGRAVLGAAAWWPDELPSVRAVLLGGLGDAAQPAHRSAATPRPDAAPRAFPDAGLALLRSRAQDGPEMWCRCDGGPHGFGAIAAHGHADALAIEVRHEGIDVLADPGTYCYHGEPAWRQHFRSTAAHNTLQLGGADSSTSGGSFLWTRQAHTTTSLVNVGDQDVQHWAGHHDGYHHLSPPLTHHREVRLESADRTITVVDRVVPGAADAGGRAVPVRLTWQLGPRVQAELDGNRAALQWPGGSAELLLPDSLSWSAHRGEQEPIQGWYSPGFGEREPATVLVGVGGPASGGLTTTLRFLDRPTG